MKSQHKTTLLAALILIGFLLLRLVSATTTATVPLTKDKVMPVYSDAAGVRKLCDQGRGSGIKTVEACLEMNNEGRAVEIRQGKKLLVDTNDYSPPGPNPKHDPGSPPSN